jgi:hypothetical protein
MARDRRELLDDNGLPINAYSRELSDEYETLTEHELRRRCREQRARIDALEMERREFVEHIARLRGEEPGMQDDQPPKQTRRRLRFP